MFSLRVREVAGQADGSGGGRTGLLWALECPAWNLGTLPRVIWILAWLSRLKNPSRAHADCREVGGDNMVGRWHGLQRKQLAERLHELGAVCGRLQDEPLALSVRSQDLREKHEHQGMDLWMHGNGCTVLAVPGLQFANDSIRQALVAETAEARVREFMKLRPFAGKRAQRPCAQDVGQRVRELLGRRFVDTHIPSS